MKAVRNNYMKNVLKSLTYSAVDVSGEYMTTVKEFADTNKEFVTATYAALKNPVAAVKKSVEAIQQSKIYQALDYGARNLAEDLRTGNFYNKARKDAETGKFMGMSADNMEDLSEFGIDDDWEKNVGKSKESEDDTVTAGDLKIVESIEGSNAAVADATVNAVISSSQHQIQSGRANVAMIYTQNERLFGGLHKDMTILGNTMQQMYKLQAASLANMDKNMSSFFTEELKLSNERNAILKEMLEMQREQYKSAMQREQALASKKKQKVRFSDLSYNGNVDIKEYFGQVKKNLANQISGIGILNIGGEDSNVLAEFMTSPMEHVLHYVVDGLIPSTIKTAARELNSSLAGIFGTAIGKLANAKKNPEGSSWIANLLAGVFGINTNLKSTVDTSKYEKGPVPFDGITRNAIINVIPTYLRRIEATLSGKPEEIFDYKAGKWVKMRELQKQKEAMRKNMVDSATREIRSAMSPALNAIRASKGTKTELDDWDAAVNEFWEFLAENNGVFNGKVSAEKNGLDSRKYRHAYAHYKELKTVFNSYDLQQIEKNNKSKNRNVRNSIRLNMANNAIEARDRYNKQLEAIEDDPSNAMYALFSAMTGLEIDKHGKYKDSKGFRAYNKLLEEKDKNGYTIYDYLANINKELIWQRFNGGFGGSVLSSGDRKPVDINSIDIRSDSVKNQTNREQENKEDIDKRLTAAAVEAIKKGKAIDSRLLQEDPEEYFRQIVAFASEMGARDFASNQAALEDKNFITRSINKYTTKTKSQKDVEDALKKAAKDAGKDGDKIEDEQEKKFLQRIGEKIGATGSIIQGIIGAGTDAFENLLYAADRAIYDMMFKAEMKDDDTGKQYNGFMDAMVGKMKSKFDELSKSFKDNFIEPMKEALGINDENKKRFKDALTGTGKSIWTSIVNANKSVYSPLIEEAEMALGIKQGEDFAKRRRADNRGNIKDYMDRVKKAQNIYTIMDILDAYGVDSTTAIDLKETKKELMEHLNRDMYNNSNKLTDDMSFTDFDAIAKFASNDPKLKKKIVRGRGMDMSGVEDKNTGKFIHANLRQEYVNRNREAFDKSYEENNFSISKDILAENYGYKGGLNRKKAAYKKYYKIFKGKTLTEDQLNRFQSVEELDKEFVKLVSRYGRHKIDAEGNATGTTGLPFSGLTTLTKGEGLFNRGGFGVVPKTGVYNVTSPTHIINTEDMHNLTGGPRVSVQQAYGKEKLAAKNAGFNIAHHDKGTSAGIQITNKGVKVDTKTFLAEAKANIPEAAAGGLVGGILSLLLGTIGGPLVGAAAGAGTMIISRSNKIKDALFGKVGKDNKRDGSGLISKTIVKAAQKYFPDMFKYGLAGLIPGLITPLGPLGGIMAGAAFGFLRNNENFTNKYLGDVDGKLHIGSKEKKIIQDLLPGAFKGAAAGAIIGTLVGGPFGLLGNAVLGSGLGMMTTTEDFKDLILGVKGADGSRMGGLVGALKDALDPFTKNLREAGDKLKSAFSENIIKPIAKFVKPAIHAIPKVLGTLPRLINDALFSERGVVHRLFSSRLGRVLGAPLGAVGWAGSKLAGGVKGVTGFLGNRVSNAADRLSVFNIRRGDTLGMGVNEAYNMVEGLGKANKLPEYFKAAAKMGTGEEGSLSMSEGENLISVLANIGSTQSKAQARLSKANRKLNNALTGYKTKDGRKIKGSYINDVIKATRDGDAEGVSRALLKSGLTKDEFNTFWSEGGLKDMVAEAKMAQSAFKKSKNFKEDEESKNLISKLQELGINVDADKLNNKRYRTNMIKLFQDRMVELQAHPDDIKEKKEKETQENITTIKDTLDKFLKAYLAKAAGDEETLKKLNEEFNRGKDAANSQYDQNISEGEEAMGEDAENLDDAGRDVLSPNKRRRKTIKFAKRFGANAVNNAIGKLGIDRISRAFKRHGIKIKAPGYLVNAFEPSAFNAIANGTKATASMIAKGLSNRWILKTIELGGYKITDETLYALAGDLKEFEKSCILLNQIYTAGNADIYGKYSKLEDIAELTVEDRSDLANEYGIEYDNETSFKTENIERSFKAFKHSLHPVRGFKKLVKGAGRGIKGFIHNALANRRKKKSSKWVNEANPDDVKYDEHGNPIEKDVESHGIGTMLLGGLGKLAGLGLRAGKAVVKGVGKGAGALLHGAKSIVSGIGHGAASLAKKLKNAVTGGGGGDLDEVNEAGDGKSVANVGNGDFISVKRDSSGNVEPDTSDSRTKTVMNKISFKEKLEEKVQNAQLKASEFFNKHFNDDTVENAGKGKLNFLALLFGGALLMKSGILGKLFDGIKNAVIPIWTEHIQPFLTDKVKPFVTDTLIPGIKTAISKVWDTGKGFLTDTVLPWLKEDVGPLLYAVLVKAVAGCIKNIPRIFDFARDVTDEVFGNSDNNAGHTATMDVDKSAEENGGTNANSHVHDDTGRELTYQDIKDNNYQGSLYNESNERVTYNEETGQYEAKDYSTPGVAGAMGIAGRAIRMGAQAMATGRNSLGVKAADALSNKLLKKKGLKGLIAKPAGAILKAGVKPSQMAEKAGLKLRDMAGKAVDKAAEGKVLKDTSGTLLAKATNFHPFSDLGEKFLNTKNKVDNAVDAAKNKAKDAVKNTANKAKDKVGDAVKAAKDKASDAVSKATNKAKETLLNKPAESAVDAAKKAGENVIDEAVQSVEEKAAKEAFQSGAEAASKKAVEEAAKNVAKDTAKEAAESAVKKGAKNGGFIKSILTKLADFIKKLFANSDVLKKITGVCKQLKEKSVDKFVAKFSNFVNGIFEKFADKAVEKAGVSVAKGVLNVAFSVVTVVADFAYGCDRAEELLAVSETSIIEELICGLVNAICNKFFIFSMFVKEICQGIYGFFNKDLARRQEESQKEYQQFLKENPTSNWSYDEWNSRKHSISGAIGGWVGDRFNDVKNFFTGGDNKDNKADTKDAQKELDESNKANENKESTDNSNKETTTPVELGRVNTPKFNGLTLKANAKGTTSGNSFLDAVKGAAKTAFKFTPMGQMVTAFNNISDIATSMFTVGDRNVKEDAKTMNKANKGKISIFSKDYWNLGNAARDTSFKGTLQRGFSALNKIINFPILMVQDALESLNNDIAVIAGSITGTKSVTTNNTTVAKTTTTTASAIKTSSTTKKATASSTASKPKSFIGGLIDGVKSFFGFGPGIYGRGYSKQIDPAVSSIRYNAYGDSEYQTIGNSGCGPAAAVNAMEAMYGMGASDIANAAQFALNRGYKEVNGGTKPGFFADYFNSNGYNAQTTFDKSRLARNINMGMPTVIMGRDARGMSSLSPFGKTPHYVTVTGIDGKGNAIVQDPESRFDNQLYPLNSLMNKTTFGVSAFGKNYKWGTGYVPVDHSAEVWWFLKKQGFSDAGAAGILGNMYQESKCDPLLIQSDGKGPAAGIVQWENWRTGSGRWKAMADYAASKGKEWTDLGSQLEYMMMELNGADGCTVDHLKKYGGLSALMNATDPIAATNIFERSFERADEGGEAQVLWNVRNAAAQRYYEQYKGTAGTEISATPIQLNGVAVDPNNYNTTGGTTGTTTDSSGGAFGGIIGDLLKELSKTPIGRAMSALLGSSDTGTSTSGSYGSTTSGSTSGGTTSSIKLTNVPANSDMAKIITIANREMGTAENPKGSNNTKYNDWYGGPGDAWCAIFQSWVAEQAGIPQSIIPKTNSTRVSYREITNNLGGAKVDVANASPGDFIYETRDGSADGIHHIGLVASNDGSVIQTIDGNYSDKVSLVNRKKDSWGGLLAARPAYANTGSGSRTGIKPLSMYGRYKDSLYGKGSVYRPKVIRKFVNGEYVTVEEPIIDVKMGEITDERKRKKARGYGYGIGPSADYSNLITAIINILMTIADNTDKLNTIVAILNSKLGSKITTTDIGNAATDELTLRAKLLNALNGLTPTANGTYSATKDDTSVQSIITAMSAIASA